MREWLASVLTKCRLGMRQPQKTKTKFLRNCPNLKRPALVMALMLLGSLWTVWLAAAPPRSSWLQVLLPIRSSSAPTDAIWSTRTTPLF